MRRPPLKTNPPKRAVEMSDREVQIIFLVAERFSNKLISNKLGISDLTVKSHLARISRKLDTTNRAQIVYRSMQLGIIH